MSNENITTDMYFLCEANINVETGTIKNIPTKTTNIFIEDGILNIIKDTRKLKGNIKDFRNLFAIIAEDITTIDFWSEEFLRTIVENNFISEVNINKAIAGKDFKGYILEAVISFPSNSSFYEKWNKERQHKGEIFMSSLSNK